MEKKINIAELLKDCQRGMELDCTMYDNLYFDKVVEDCRYPIGCYTIYDGCRTSVNFTEFGEFNNYGTAKCVIFPKGKTTWEEFRRPFKDGDIVSTSDGKWIGITTGGISGYVIPTYCVLDSENEFHGYFHRKEEWQFHRFATEEEKQKLFQAIKDNGYKWNEKTKTLEKLVEPKFHKGDWVTDGVSKCQIRFIDDTQYWYSENCILGSIESVDKRYHLWTIQDAKDGDVIFYDSGWTCIFKCIHGIWYSSYCFITCDGEFQTSYERHDVDSTINGNAHPATEEEKEKLFQAIKDNGYKWNPETKTLEKLIVPKFKVGDKIKKKGLDDIYAIKIAAVTPIIYTFQNNGFLYIETTDKNYELVPNKFDITTFKPFDKVLVRCSSLEKWRIQFFEKYDKTCKFPFICMGYNKYKQCIPYNDNEPLLDTTDDCDEFYKTW